MNNGGYTHSPGFAAAGGVRGDGVPLNLTESVALP